MAREMLSIKALGGQQCERSIDSGGIGKGRWTFLNWCLVDMGRHGNTDLCHCLLRGKNKDGCCHDREGRGANDAVLHCPPNAESRYCSHCALLSCDGDVKQGFGFIDGILIGEVLYQRSPDDPVTYGCVLMSTRKMTVEEAASPTTLVNSIIASLLPEGGWLDLAWTIANTAFAWQVAHHADMYIIMKHWYCDAPEMITRKDFYLYSDAACTKLVKSLSAEAPVGVAK